MSDSARGSFSQLYAWLYAGIIDWQHVGSSSQAAWVPGRVQRVLRDTYDQQFKFTGVTRESKFGPYSTTAVLEY